MEQKTSNKIEEMYRSYPRIKDKLLILTPKNTQFLSFSPGGGGEESKVEKIALARVDLERQLKIIQKCLKQLAQEERIFVEYRYFHDKDIETVALMMNRSRRGIFRLCKSILNKTYWLWL